MRLRQSVLFDAPPEAVWTLFTDPQRWAQWNTEWAELRDVRGPFDHRGAGYTQVFRVFGFERLGRWEVLACEPGCWREVRGTLPLGIPFRGRDEFRAMSVGTQVTLEIAWDTPWGVVGGIIERAAVPLIRRRLRANALRAAALLKGPAAAA